MKVYCLADTYIDYKYFYMQEESSSKENEDGQLEGRWTKQ